MPLRVEWTAPQGEVADQSGCLWRDDTTDEKRHARGVSISDAAHVSRSGRDVMKPECHPVRHLFSDTEGGEDEAKDILEQVVGNFPGSPVDLRFFFKLEGDKIASLEIIP